MGVSGVRTLAFEGDAAVTLTAGNYDYYLEKRAARSTSIAPQPAVAKSPARAAKVRKLSYKEQRELETIESDIEVAEQQATRLEEQLTEVNILRNQRPRMARPRSANGAS